MVLPCVAMQSCLLPCSGGALACVHFAACHIKPLCHTRVCLQGITISRKGPLAIHPASFLASSGDTQLNDMLKPHISGAILPSGHWQYYGWALTPVQLAQRQAVVHVVKGQTGEEFVRVSFIPCHMFHQEYMHMCYWGARKVHTIQHAGRARGGQSHFKSNFALVPIFTTPCKLGLAPATTTDDILAAAFVCFF